MKVGFSLNEAINGLEMFNGDVKKVIEFLLDVVLKKKKKNKNKNNNSDKKKK